MLAVTLDSLYKIIMGKSLTSNSKKLTTKTYFLIYEHLHHAKILYMNYHPILARIWSKTYNTHFTGGREGGRKGERKGEGEEKEQN